MTTTDQPTSPTPAPEPVPYLEPAIDAEAGPLLAAVKAAFDALPADYERERRELPQKLLAERNALITDTAKLAAANAVLRQERNEAREQLTQAIAERDLAIAHDRQPYPTADAYETTCRALEKHRARADAAEARYARLAGEVAELAKAWAVEADSLRDARDTSSRPDVRRRLESVAHVWDFAATRLRALAVESPKVQTGGVVEGTDVFLDSGCIVPNREHPSSINASHARVSVELKDAAAFAERVRQTVLAATAPQTAPAQPPDATKGINWEGVPVARGRMSPSATTTLTLDNSAGRPQPPTAAAPEPVRVTDSSEADEARQDALMLLYDAVGAPPWVEPEAVAESIRQMAQKAYEARQHPLIPAHPAGDEHLQALRSAEQAGETRGMDRIMTACTSELAGVLDTIPPDPADDEGWDALIEELRSVMREAEKAHADLDEARREAERLRGEVAMITESSRQIADRLSVVPSCYFGCHKAVHENAKQLRALAGSSDTTAGGGER